MQHSSPFLISSGVFIIIPHSRHKSVAFVFSRPTPSALIYKHTAFPKCAVQRRILDAIVNVIHKIADKILLFCSELLHLFGEFTNMVFELLDVGKGSALRSTTHPQPSPSLSYGQFWQLLKVLQYTSAFFISSCVFIVRPPVRRAIASCTYQRMYGKGNLSRNHHTN